MIPYRYIAMVLVGLALLAGSYWKGHVNGANGVKAEWQAEQIGQMEEAEAIRIAHQAEIDKLAKSYAAKAAKQRQVVISNASKVEQYAPSSFPPLPGSFRVWHDAAAEGQALDDSSGIAGASVSLKDTAATVADNYASCNYDKYRLSVLQEIVKKLTGGEDGETEKD